MEHRPVINYGERVDGVGSLGGGGHKLAFRDPNPRPQLHTGKTYTCRVRVMVF